MNNNHFQKFLEFINLQTSDLQLCGDIKLEFGSNTDNHRQKIRNQICNANDLSVLQKNIILNLDLPPKLDHLYFSISHTLDSGGFIQARSPIGFDIEKTDRLNSKIVERISNAAEISQSPGQDFIWTAKEAIYKALSADSNIKVVSQIQLIGWKKHNFIDNMFFYTYSTPQEPSGRGYSFAVDGFCYSIYVNSKAE